MAIGHSHTSGRGPLYRQGMDAIILRNRPEHDGRKSGASHSWGAARCTNRRILRPDTLFPNGRQKRLRRPGNRQPLQGATEKLHGVPDQELVNRLQARPVGLSVPSARQCLLVLFLPAKPVDTAWLVCLLALLTCSHRYSCRRRSLPAVFALLPGLVDDQCTSVRIRSMGGGRLSGSSQGMAAMPGGLLCRSRLGVWATVSAFHLRNRLGHGSGHLGTA